MGYNNVFSISQVIEQLGKVSKKHDWGNNQKRTKKGCMPFYHNFRSYVSKVVSTRRTRAIREKAGRVAIGGQEKKGDFEGKV